MASNSARRGTFTWKPEYGDINPNNLHDYTLLSLKEYYRSRVGYAPPSNFNKAAIIDLINGNSRISAYPDIRGNPQRQFSGMTASFLPSPSQSQFSSATASSSNSWSGFTSNASSTPPVNLPRTTKFHVPVYSIEDARAYYKIVKDEVLVSSPSLTEGIKIEAWVYSLPSAWKAWRNTHPLRQIKPNNIVNFGSTMKLPPDTPYSLIHAQGTGEVISAALSAIMKVSDPKTVLADAIRELGYLSLALGSTAIDYAMMLDLIYYYGLINKNFTPSLKSQPSQEIAYYIERYSNAQLVELLGGSSYQGPTDRASLLFAAHTGQIPEQISYTAERYQLVAQSSLAQLAWMTTYAHPLITVVEGVEYPIITAIGPVRFLAAQPPTAVDAVLFGNTIENAAERAKSLGIHLPQYNGATIGSPYLILRDSQKLLSDLNNWLKDYGEAVLTRPSGISLPSLPLTDPQQLRFFTDQELADYYEFGPTILRRPMISEIVNDKPKWKVARFRYATNAQEYDVSSGDRRADEFAKPNANILSYGRIGNYQSWTAEELAYTFGPEPDGSYLFRMPSGHDKFFSLSVIRALDKLLTYIIDIGSTEYQELADIVTKGLQYHTKIAQNIASLKIKYLSFTVEERSLITLYIFWLFTFGQYARFWKGPGNPYQYEAMNFVFMREDRQLPQFCTPYQRDILSAVQLVIYETILYDLSQRPNAAATIAWVQDLPIVKYDIRLDEAVLTISNELETIGDLLEKAGGAQLCMMFTSDSTVETAFFIARRILGLEHTSEFNQLLRQILPILRKMELEIVKGQIYEREAGGREIQEQIRQLDPRDNSTPERRHKLLVEFEIVNNNDQLKTLRARLQQLLVEPMPYQEDFDPLRRSSTGEYDRDQFMRELD